MFSNMTLARLWVARVWRSRLKFQNKGITVRHALTFTFLLSFLSAPLFGDQGAWYKGRVWSPVGAVEGR